MGTEDAFSIRLEGVAEVQRVIFEARQLIHDLRRANQDMVEQIEALKKRLHEEPALSMADIERRLDVALSEGKIALEEDEKEEEQDANQSEQTDDAT